MRKDGRGPGEMRPVAFQRHFTGNAAGSVLASFGNTRVICTASVESRVPPWLKDSGKGWVTAEYAMLPGSTHDRVSREANKKGRALEISRLIGRSLRGVMDLEALGEIMITLDCDVIEADGGTRTAAISGAYVALHDALLSLQSSGMIETWPLRAACAAASVGIVQGETLLDLCYEEDAVADVDMNVVMNSAGEFIEIQGSAEGAPFNRSAALNLLEAAESGIATILRAQKEALGHA